MAGWGSAIGKIFDLIPGRKESILNEIDKTEKRMAALDSKKPYTTADAFEYQRLADRLGMLKNKLKNSTASS